MEQQQPQQFQQAAPGFAPPGAVPMQWMPQPAPVDVEKRDRKFRTQGLCVRVAAFVATVIALIILIAQGSIYQGDYEYDDEYPELRYNWVGIPVVVVTMCWNIAEFITYCVNRRGAHPGVHVGLDLLAFLALSGGGIYSILCGPTDGPILTSYDISAATMQIVSSALHLSLFIMACIATSRRNRAARHPEGHYAHPPPGMVFMVPVQGQPPANFQPTANEMAGAGQTPTTQQHVEMMGDKAIGVPQTGVPIQTAAAPPYTTSPAQTEVPIQTSVPVTTAPPAATTAPPYTTGAAEAQTPQPGVPAPTPVQGWTAAPVQPAAPTQKAAPPSQPANLGNTNNAR